MIKIKNLKSNWKLVWKPTADTLNVHGDYRILTLSCYRPSEVITLCLNIHGDYRILTLSCYRPSDVITLCLNIHGDDRILTLSCYRPSDVITLLFEHSRRLQNSDTFLLLSEWRYYTVVWTFTATTEFWHFLVIVRVTLLHCVWTFTATTEFWHFLIIRVRLLHCVCSNSFECTNIAKWQSCNADSFKTAEDNETLLVTVYTYMTIKQMSNFCINITSCCWVSE